MIKKLQNLPDAHKKIIIIAVVILLGAVMGFFWITFSARDLSKIEEAANSIGLPTIELPNFDIPVENDPGLENTANWQTYTNVEYGFEIAYPKEWFMQTTNTDAFSFAVSPENPEDHMAFSAEALQIAIFKIENTSSLEQEIKNRFANQNISFTKENVTIDGIDGFKIVTQCQAVGCGNPEWVFMKDNYFYHIGVGLNYRPALDQIISTFKFTNTTK